MTTLLPFDVEATISFQMIFMLFLQLIKISDAIISYVP